MKLWKMNNHTLAATEAMSTVTDVNWKIVGVADIDSDGRQELIWHHQTSGSVVAWERNPTNATWFSYNLGSAMAPASWQFAGAGDFNLDGSDDLVWRNAASSLIQLWTTKDGTVVDSNNLSQMATSAWTLAGVGDFNHDLYPDFFWRNDSTWASVIWLMKDRAVLGSGNTSSADPAYKIVRVGDLNGDDYADVVWRHSTGGDVVVWQMNTYAASSLFISNPGTQWSITAK